MVDLGKIKNILPYSVSNYHKMPTFLGKLDSPQPMEKFIMNDQNLIQKAKQIIIKEKLIKKKLSHMTLDKYVSSEKSITKLNRRVESFSEFNFSVSKNSKNYNFHEKDNLDNHKYEKSSKKINLKPTPFQIREDETLRNKSLINEKQIIRNSTEEILLSNSYKNSERETIIEGSSSHNINTFDCNHRNSNPQSDDLKHFSHSKNNFSVIFKNSPNKRRSPLTRKNSLKSDSLNFDISSLKKKQSDNNLNLRLPLIKTNFNKNSTPRTDHINYEPRKKEHYFKNFNFQTCGFLMK